MMQAKILCIEECLFHTWPHLLEEPGITQEFMWQDDVIELSSMCTACLREVYSPGDPLIGG